MADAPDRIFANKTRHAKWGASGRWHDDTQPHIGVSVEYIRADWYDKAISERDAYRQELDGVVKMIGDTKGRTFWAIRARRASDFATVEEERDTEEAAQRHARHYFAQGYDVRVHRVEKSIVAEWRHDDESLNNLADWGQDFDSQ